jgi:hypothetical protein
MKTLLKSRWFFDPSNRFALVEGPVSWSVRTARALGYDLAAADALSPKGFPAWALVVNGFDQGARGTIDHGHPLDHVPALPQRRLAMVSVGAGDAAGGPRPSRHPAPARSLPRRAGRRVAPGPVALGVHLDPASADTQARTRQLAYLVLCSPAGQLY